MVSREKYSLDKLISSTWAQVDGKERIFFFGATDPGVHFPSTRWLIPELLRTEYQSTRWLIPASSGELKASCPIRALIHIKKCLLQTLTHNRLTERIKKDIQSRGGDNRDDNSHLPPNIRDKRPRSHDPVGQRCHTAADLGEWARASLFEGTLCRPQFGTQSDDGLHIYA